MVESAKKLRVLGGGEHQLFLDNTNKVLIYKKGGAYFAFNFHPWQSYDGQFIVVDEPGTYQVQLTTDDYHFGGQGRIWHQNYETEQREDGAFGFRMYLPSRTALVFKRLPKRK